jgi:hypothetical protein
VDEVYGPKWLQENRLAEAIRAYSAPPVEADEFGLEEAADKLATRQRIAYRDAAARISGVAEFDAAGRLESARVAVRHAAAPTDTVDRVVVGRGPGGHELYEDVAVTVAGNGTTWIEGSSHGVAAFARKVTNNPFLKVKVSPEDNSGQPPVVRPMPGR